MDAMNRATFNLKINPIHGIKMFPAFAIFTACMVLFLSQHEKKHHIEVLQQQIQTLQSLDAGDIVSAYMQVDSDSTASFDGAEDQHQIKPQTLTPLLTQLAQQRFELPIAFKSRCTLHLNLKNGEHLHLETAIDKNEAIAAIQPIMAGNIRPTNSMNNLRLTVPLSTLKKIIHFEEKSQPLSILCPIQSYRYI